MFRVIKGNFADPEGRKANWVHGDYKSLNEAFEQTRGCMNPVEVYDEKGRWVDLSTPATKCKKK